MDANMQQYEDEITIDLLEIVKVLLKHWVKIVAVTLVGGIIGLLFTMFMITPMYQAEATMIVNSRQDVSGANITNDQIVSSQKLVETYAIIIKSRRIIEPIIDELDLDTSYEQLTSKIDVSSVNSTQIMKISVRDANPQIALMVVEMIVDEAPAVIMDTMEAGSVKTVSMPYVNAEEPVSPNKMKNAVIAAFLACVLSVGMICLFTLLDNTFKSEEDIQKHLDLPVLGIIPTIESCKRKE